MTQDHYKQGTPQNAGNDGEWRTIIEEDFSYGFGFFNYHSNANHYVTTMNRAGVIRISGGEEGHSLFTSEHIFLGRNRFVKFKIGFYFYVVQIDPSDNFCVEYKIDGGVITGKKCWSGLRASQNSVWIDDKSFEFAASGAERLQIVFGIKGYETDVLMDSLTIQGQI